MGIYADSLINTGWSAIKSHGPWQSIGFDIWMCKCGMDWVTDDAAQVIPPLDEPTPAPGHEDHGWLLLPAGEYAPDASGLAAKAKAHLQQYVIRQKVARPDTYAKNPDGSQSKPSKRAEALESVVGQMPPNGRKFRFVVCTQSLPGLEGWGKSDQKPYAYMWPLEEAAKRGLSIDYAWYHGTMLRGYIEGAFNFESLSVVTQTKLAESGEGATSWDY